MTPTLQRIVFNVVLEHTQHPVHSVPAFNVLPAPQITTTTLQQYASLVLLEPLPRLEPMEPVLISHAPKALLTTMLLQTLLVSYVHRGHTCQLAHQEAVHGLFAPLVRLMKMTCRELSARPVVQATSLLPTHLEHVRQYLGALLDLSITTLVPAHHVSRAVQAMEVSLLDPQALVPTTFVQLDKLKCLVHAMSVLPALLVMVDGMSRVSPALLALPTMTVIQQHPVSHAQLVRVSLYRVIDSMPNSKCCDLRLMFSRLLFLSTLQLLCF